MSKVYLKLEAVDKFIIDQLSRTYREYIYNWKLHGGKDRWNREFKGKYRVYLPLLTENHIENLVRKELHTNHNWVVSDYAKGLGYPSDWKEKKLQDLKDKGITLNNESLRKLKPREEKFAKLLTPSVMHMFVTDPVRSKTRVDAKEGRERRKINPEDWMVVISRHPIDVASMSTGRRWRSCMTLGHETFYCEDQLVGTDENGEPLTPEAMERDGINIRYMDIDIGVGTLTAYVVKKQDTKIRDPYCRLNIKPYYEMNRDTGGATGKIALIKEDQEYGEYITGFNETVNDWLRDTFDYTSIAYSAVSGLYINDSTKENITIFNLLPTSEYGNVFDRFGFTELKPGPLTEENRLRVAYREKIGSYFPSVEIVIAGNPKDVKEDFFSQYGNALPLFIEFSRPDDKARTNREDIAALSKHKNIKDYIRESRADLSVYDKSGHRVYYDINKLGQVVGDCLKNHPELENLFSSYLDLLPTEKVDEVAFDVNKATKAIRNLSNVRPILERNPKILLDSVFFKKFLYLITAGGYQAFSLNNLMHSAFEVCKDHPEPIEKLKDVYRHMWSKGSTLPPKFRINNKKDLITFFKSYYVSNENTNSTAYIQANPGEKYRDIAYTHLTQLIDLSKISVYECIEALIDNNIQVSGLTLCRVMAHRDVFKEKPAIVKKLLVELSNKTKAESANRNLRVAHRYEDTDVYYYIKNAYMFETVFGKSTETNEAKNTARLLLNDMVLKTYRERKYLIEGLSHYFVNVGGRFNSVYKVDEPYDKNQLGSAAVSVFEDFIPNFLMSYEKFLMVDLVKELIGATGSVPTKTSLTNITGVQALKNTQTMIEDDISTINRALGEYFNKAEVYSHEVDWGKIRKSSSPVGQWLLGKMLHGSEYSDAGISLVDKATDVRVGELLTILVKNHYRMDVVDAVLLVAATRIFSYSQSLSKSKKTVGFTKNEVNRNLLMFLGMKGVGADVDTKVIAVLQYRFIIAVISLAGSIIAEGYLDEKQTLSNINRYLETIKPGVLDKIYNAGIEQPDVNLWETIRALKIPNLETTLKREEPLFNKLRLMRESLNEDALDLYVKAEALTDSQVSTLRTLMIR